MPKLSNVEIPLVEDDAILEVTLKDGSITRFNNPSEWKNVPNMTDISMMSWITGEDHVGVNMMNGSFLFRGLELFVDLCLTKDIDGNIQRVYQNELTFRPIFFKRIRKDFTPEAVITSIGYCIGWQTTYEEKNYQKIMMLFNGKLTIMDGK